MDDNRAASRLGQLCSVRVERTLGTVLIRLHGEFDLACVERFQEELDGALDDEAQTLIIDLRGLEFIDSSGLRMLVMLNRTTSEDGLGFTVLCGDGAVRRVLRETGLDGVLPVAGPAGAVPHSGSPIYPSPAQETPAISNRDRQASETK